MKFSEETEARTAECLRELWATTTEDKLLRAAGGNKWIARRAIELYKREYNLLSGFQHYDPEHQLEFPFDLSRVGPCYVDEVKEGSWKHGFTLTTPTPRQ